MRNILDSISKRITKVSSHEHCSGEGYIIKDRIDAISFEDGSKVILNKDLILNANRIQHVKLPSTLRMDANSTLECNGFTFMYGADVILFHDSRLILGENSFINSDCKIRCHNEIEIGDDCAISHDFTIMDSDAHELNGRREALPIHIGNHVWIGTRVTILKGVTVGDGAVIAAGSLVINDVPTGTLVGGVPAKIIKEKIEWKK